MKPPTKGASRGPVKTAMEKIVMAAPLVALLYMSEKTAATTARGHAPKKPAKNRQIKRVCRSFAVAQAMVKTEKPNMETTIGSLRPFNSERGAQNVGPVAKPNTYRDTPRIPTSELTLNSAATWVVAAEKMEEVKAEVIVV